MAAIVETIRRLIPTTRPKTETPSPSVFRLTMKIDGATVERHLPCGYQTTIFNGNPISIGVVVIGPEKISVEEKHSIPPHVVCYDWTIAKEKGAGHFTGKGFEPDGEGVEPKREITKGVYFNDRLTELHFPDGLISLM